MIVSKTPLRISFAGGGTDLPSFYRFNDYGAVLSTSINKYIYVPGLSPPKALNALRRDEVNLTTMGINFYRARVQKP